jgi:hypothetical protein
MAETPPAERMRKMRHRRQGRGLSCWLHPPADSYFRKLKKLTGATNDETISAALESGYRTLYWERVGELSLAIDELRAIASTRDDLTVVYRELVAVLAIDYPEPADIKTVLNQRRIPDYAGAVGKWRVDQIRKLIA